MQDMKTIKALGQNPAVILDKDLALDLLVRETRFENLRKDREQRDIFNQGEIALDNAAYNNSDSEVIHTNGHVIQNNRGRNNKYHTEHKEKDPHGLKAMALMLEQAGVAAAVLQSWMQGITATLAPSPSKSSALKGTFDDKAQDSMQIVMDENFIYGGEVVTNRTAELFNKRIQRILDMQKAIEEETNPTVKADLEDKFERLVQRTDAIYHPDVGWSICSARVGQVNDHIVERHGECTDGVVCSYSPVTFGSHNGRKMKIDVGDQFDDNPTETIGEVKAEVTQRVAPPEFKFVR
jgi:phosphoribosyl-ATP pyrophosphohydrolase